LYAASVLSSVAAGGSSLAVAEPLTILRTNHYSLILHKGQIAQLAFVGGLPAHSALIANLSFS
jgi:hypothetical protein